MPVYHRHYDAEYRLHYFHSSETGESLWVCPTGSDVKIVLHPEEEPRAMLGVDMRRGEHEQGRTRSRSPHAIATPASGGAAPAASAKHRTVSPSPRSATAAISRLTAVGEDAPLLTAPAARSPPAAVLRPLPSLAALSGAMNQTQREGIPTVNPAHGTHSHDSQLTSSPAGHHAGQDVEPTVAANRGQQMQMGVIPASSPYVFDPSVPIRNSRARSESQQGSSMPLTQKASTSPTPTAQPHISAHGGRRPDTDDTAHGGNALYSRLTRTAASVMQGSISSPPSSPLQYVADLLDGGGVGSLPQQQGNSGSSSSSSSSPARHGVVTLSGDDLSVSPRVALSHAAASRVFGNPLDGRASELLCQLLGQDWMKGADPAAAILAGTAPAGSATLVAPRVSSVSLSASEAQDPEHTLAAVPTQQLQAIVARHTKAERGSKAVADGVIVPTNSVAASPVGGPDNRSALQDKGSNRPVSPSLPWKGPTATKVGTPTVRPLGHAQVSSSPVLNAPRPASHNNRGLLAAHPLGAQLEDRPSAEQVKAEEDRRRAAHGVTVRSALAGSGNSPHSSPLFQTRTPIGALGLAFTGPTSPGQAARLTAQGIELGPEYWQQALDTRPLPGMPEPRERPQNDAASSASPSQSVAGSGLAQDSTDSFAVRGQRRQVRGRAAAREQSLSQQLLPSLIAAGAQEPSPGDDGLADGAASAGQQGPGGRKRTPTPPRPKSLHGRGRRPVAQQQVQYPYPYPYFEEEPVPPSSSAASLVTIAASPHTEEPAVHSTGAPAAATETATHSTTAKTLPLRLSTVSTQANKVAAGRALHSKGSMSAMDRAALAAVLLATTPLDDESLAAAGAW